MNKFKRLARHKKIQKKLRGTTLRPRISVFRSSQHIYAQIIDDSKQITLVSSTDIKIKKGTKKEKAFIIGGDLAKKALSKKIKEAVFDRGGFKFHGRVAAVAEGARKGGLKF